MGQTDDEKDEIMKIINLMAIYVLWLREMKVYLRSKSRVAGMIVMPLFFLIFLGFGLKGVALPGMPVNVDYITFLVPGIIGMTMLFISMFAGLSVLWDREFGFLKEIMIAPINRISIVLGRIAGGVTTAVIQGLLVLGLSLFIGFKITSISGVLLSIVFMVLISTVFIGLGLIFASKMRDMQGFGLIMQFVVYPLFFLSGALFPLENLPDIIKYIAYADPLTYGVDGLRGALLGASSMPLVVNLSVLIGFALLMIFLGAYFFEKSKSI